MKLLKNASYHVPVIGAIRLGGLLPMDGRAVLYQNDFFAVTENFKKNDKWVEHPLQQELLDKLPSKANGRLSEISVRVVFSNPSLNTSERFEAYDPVSKKLQCVGDGAEAVRVDSVGNRVKQPCVGPEFCQYGEERGCRLMARTAFQINGQSDELGVFMLRSSGYNSMTTLRTRLELMSAKFGKALRYIPLKLVLRAKSSVISEDKIFYYPDLIVDGNEVDLAVLANSQMTRDKAAGINIENTENKMMQLQENDPFTLWSDDLTEFSKFDVVNVQKNPVADTNEQATSKLAKSDFVLALSRPIEIEEHIGIVNAEESVEALFGQPKKADEVEEENITTLSEKVVVIPKNELARISKTRKIPKIPSQIH